MSTDPAGGPTHRRLSRSAGDGRPAAPVRIVHLGLGNFSRAHQAWYTDHAPDATGWGIAAFTGRTADLAEVMAPQDGLYTLVIRNADGDNFEVVSSISAVHAASEHEAWLAYLCSPDLAIITITVTEAGYLRAADGGLDVDNGRIREDLAALRGDPTVIVGTVPGPTGRRPSRAPRRARGSPRRDPVRQPARERRSRVKGGHAAG